MAGTEGIIIGYEAKRVFHNRSGLGNYSRNLIRLMAQHHPENRYLLYNPKEGPVSFGEYLPQVYEKRPRVPNNLYRQLWRQRLLSGRAARDGVEVFHGLSQELPLGLRRKGIPSAVTVHDLIFLRYPQLYAHIDRKIYLRKLRSACRRADLIVATSKQTREDLIHYLGIPEKRIAVIYQGINPIFWETFDREECRNTVRQFDLPEDFALFVGNLEERKGVGRLLEAQRQLKIPVVYVGRSTKFWRKLRKDPKYRGIETLIFQPRVPRDEDLARLYQAARLMVYPSLFEGFGIPVLEALASRTPVITSQRSSLPEVAGPDSILIDPEDQEALNQALEELWQNEGLREKLRQSGYTFASNFRDEEIARHWQRIYQQLKTEGTWKS